MLRRVVEAAKNYNYRKLTRLNNISMNVFIQIFLCIIVIILALYLIPLILNALAVVFHLRITAFNVTY